MHELWDVDAVCKIPAWSRYKCKKDHGLLPTLRQKDDGDADVWRLQIRARRMERGRNMLCLP